MEILEYVNGISDTKLTSYSSSNTGICKFFSYAKVSFAQGYSMDKKINLENFSLLIIKNVYRVNMIYPRSFLKSWGKDP